jgi:hypothetical protein
MTVRYRFKKVVGAGEVLSLKVRLVEGNSPGNVIAEWEHSSVTNAYTDGEQTLTPGEFALIGDFDDLYVEFEAIEVLPSLLLNNSHVLLNDGSYVLLNHSHLPDDSLTDDDMDLLIDGYGDILVAG